MTRAKDISKIVSDANFGGTLDVVGVLTGTSLDISGDIDVDGTTNLDVVDIDGAVDMASTLAVSGVASFADGTVSAPALTFNSDTNMGLYRGGTDILKFVTAGTDRVTINASGSVLFGQSLNDRPAEFTQPTGASIAGASGFLHGQYQSSVSGLNMLINRKGSDGPIIAFRKDGSSLGEIGVATNLNIGSGSTRIWFKDDTKSLRPISTAIGNGSDGLISIGEASGGRFKDLYLSGGVVFDAVSGNATSNTLDDYEEGTWTPAITGGTATGMSGTYTKVGRLVTITLSLVNSTIGGSPTHQITGLPFTNGSIRSSVSPTYHSVFNVTCESVSGIVPNATSHIEFLGLRQNNSWLTASLTTGSTRYLHMTTSYQI